MTQFDSCPVCATKVKVVCSEEVARYGQGTCWYEPLDEAEAQQALRKASDQRDRFRAALKFAVDFDNKYGYVDIETMLCFLEEGDVDFAS